MTEFQRTGQYTQVDGIDIPNDCECAECGDALKKGQKGSRVTPIGGSKAHTFYFCGWSCADRKIHGISDEPYCQAHPD